MQKIKIMTKFVTADTHFGHQNSKGSGILEFTERYNYFKTIEEHDEALIERWNSVVNDNDEVYHLGDFAFKNSNKATDILNRLKGRIHLIKGNHEKSVLKGQAVKRFETVNIYFELKDYKYEDQLVHIIMFHYPIQEWFAKFHGSLHIHGHSHGATPTIGRRMDVGVDNPLANYTPMKLDFVIGELLKIDYKTVLSDVNNQYDRAKTLFNLLSKENKEKFINEMIK